MKAKLSIVILLVLALTAPLVGAVGAQGPGLSAAVAPAADAQARAAAVLRGSPVLFIQNVGQFADGARFQVRGGDRTFWLAEDALWVTVLESPASPQPETRETLPLPFGREARAEGQPRQGVHLRLTFPGANPHPRLEPFDRLETSVNYFLGNDPARWRTDVPVWGGVRYVDLYPGMDLELAGEGGRLTPRLVCRADCQFALRDVRLKVEGADAIAMGAGGLRLTTAVGQFTLPLFQAVAADGTPLGLEEVRPAVAGGEVSAPFSSAPLLPGPLASAQDNPSDLLYATFLGGSSVDEGEGIAVDGEGNAYVTGRAGSSDFPVTPGAFDMTHNGFNDVFVAKLEADGSGLLYATFLGGSAPDYGYGIAVDGYGNAYVTGETSSPDFSTTSGALDRTFNGSEDAFVAKLNASGSGLLYATFLGGSYRDYGYGIAVDGTGNAYVTGFTSSSGFPTTPGAFDQSFNGGYNDVFVAKLNASGSGLLYATFLGGSGGEGGFGIAVDGAGNAHVTGWTRSSNFPATQGAFNTTHNGDEDVFVAKLKADGSELAYATFLGGSGSDWGEGIAVDGAGNAYVTGETDSSDFPTTEGAFDRTYNGYDDAFVAKLKADGSELLYATFLGGVR